MKTCYGKVYTALRTGAADADVADLAVRGVERDIRRDGGAPAFGPAVQLAVLITSQASGSSSQQLVRNIDDLHRLYGESSLTRHILSAVEKVALSALSEGVFLSRLDASERIIAQMARSRLEELLALTKPSIQASTLAEALRSPSPWSALCIRWPDLIRTQMEFGSATFQETTIDLLRRPVSEWQAFTAPLREPALALAA
jgi:hypothetical protein